MTLPLYLVDAFADQPFTGNPAAVVPLDTWLPDDTLQAMAAEHNLSETAFFVPTTDETADFDIRWFTPTVEVPLCGHATLASAHILYTELGFGKETLRLATRTKGVLTVTQAGKDLYTLSLGAESQKNIALADALAAKLRLTVLEAYQGDYLMLVLPDAKAVEAYVPDFAAIAATGHEVIITAAGPQTGSYAGLDFVSRMFAPSAGINEDPVTGSAHAQLTPYWSLVLQKTDLQAAQIGPRPGRLSASLQGSRVVLTGAARTYAKGQILL